jgi:hypothetical protein
LLQHVGPKGVAGRLVDRDYALSVHSRTHGRGGVVATCERQQKAELESKRTGLDVIPGQANVRGSLDKEIIRRVIQRHINDVKYCYEQELTKKPDLGGRIMVEVTIAASGQVIASALENSTIGNARRKTARFRLFAGGSSPSSWAEESLSFLTRSFSLRPAEAIEYRAPGPRQPPAGIVLRGRCPNTP